MNTIRTNPDSRWFGVIGVLTTVALLGILAGAARNNASVAVLSVSPSPDATITTEPTEIYPPTDDWGATETAEVIFYVTQAAFRATLEYDQTHQPTSVEPTLISGIINGVGSIWSDTPYELENSWQDQVDNQWVGVLAGAYRADLTQGIVVMGWEEAYETPLKAGSLHIVDEQNYRLTLLSADGTIFYFDIPGRRFVESLTEIVPTITPVTPSPTSPSPTPTITPTSNPTWLTPWPTCTPIPPSLATSGPCIP